MNKAYELLGSIWASVLLSVRAGIGFKDMKPKHVGYVAGQICVCHIKQQLPERTPNRALARTTTVNIVRRKAMFLLRNLAEVRG